VPTTVFSISWSTLNIAGISSVIATGSVIG